MFERVLGVGNIDTRSGTAARRLLSTVIFLASVFLIIPCFIQADNAQAASISGTVTNNTGSTGWVYLSIKDSTGGITSLGTAVQVASHGSAPYTIRGVEVAGNPRTYIVRAFLDVYGTTIQSSNSPLGASASIPFSGSSISGINITLSAPDFVGLSGKVPAPHVFTISTAALINFDSDDIKAGGLSNGLYVPEAMRIYWGYSSGNISNVTTVPVDGRGKVLILTGLSSGSTLYYRLVPVVNGVDDTANQSDIFNTPLTTPAGGSTLTGSVVSNGISKSSVTPLYIAVMNNSGAYIAYVGNPANTQSYTVSGVIAGTYEVNAILDMDNNGVIGVPDIMNANVQKPTITVDGSNPFTVPDIILSSGNAEVKSGLTHMRSGSSDNYQLNYKIEPKQKQPVGASIRSGSNLVSSVPIDLAWIGDWSEIQGSPVLSARPSVGDTYALRVYYSDSTQEDLSLPVTAVLDKFASPIYPLGTTATDSTSPLFSWLSMGSIPTGYFDYRIWVQQASDFSTVWMKNDSMLANQLSVPYNSDGNASSGSLSAGTGYDWVIAVEDAFGNQSQYHANFTPQNSGPSVSSFNPTSGTSGTSLSITGTGFDSGTPSNNIVAFGGITAAVGTASSTQMTTTVPPNAPVGPITVRVGGITASSSTSFEPTVVFSGTVKNYATTNQGGVTVSTVGLAPTYSEVSTSTSAGAYTIAVPSGFPFSLHFSKTGYLDLYTSVMQQTQDNSGSTYTLYTTSDLANLGITLNAGKGLIGGLRARVSLFEDGSNMVSGAVVNTISKNHGANYYTVAYTNPINPNGIVSGAGTSTFTDGIFYVLNVDEGDYVAVTASYAGWGFETRTWITHAGAVSENRLRGTPRPIVTPSTAAGTYCSAQSVTLTAGGSSGQACASGCTVFYTTNGNDPTLPGANSSPGSAGPISIPSTTTLKYYAKNGDNISGTVTTANYIISSSVSGTCGSSNFGIFTTAPTTNLCNTGTPPPDGVSGTGPWTWTCSGVCGGGDSLCSAGVSYLVTANASGTGSGSISSSPVGISYNYPAVNTSSAAFQAGSGPALTAVANPGGTVSWEAPYCLTRFGNGTMTAICTTMVFNAGNTVAATFTLNQYAISVNGAGVNGGTISDGSVISATWNGATLSGTSSRMVDYGSGPYIITAVANPGINVTLSGACDSKSGDGSGTATCTINSGVAEAKNVTATFSSACNLPVWIASTAFYFNTISDAYPNVTADGQMIQMQTSDIIDANPIYSGSHPIKIQGGFDCGYATNGGFTTIHGKMTFKGGAVTIERVIIK